MVNFCLFLCSHFISFYDMDSTGFLSMEICNLVLIRYKDYARRIWDIKIMPGESGRVLFLKLVVRQIVWLSLITSFIKTNNSLLLKSSVVPTITGFFISRMCIKGTYLQSNSTGLKIRNTNQNKSCIVLKKNIYPLFGQLVNILNSKHVWLQFIPE